MTALPVAVARPNRARISILDVSSTELNGENATPHLLESVQMLALLDTLVYGLRRSNIEWKMMARYNVA